MVINFEQDINVQQYRSRVILGQAERPKMLDLVLKTGIVKSENSAAMVLIIVSAVVFIISIVIFVRSGSNSNSVPPPIVYPDGTISPDITS